jgi:hypothetical protein
MRSRWTHAICVSCWKLRNGERDPVGLKDPEVETCCFCGKKTSSGVYVRFDPAETLCKGNHEEVKDAAS